MSRPIDALLVPYVYARTSSSWSPGIHVKSIFGAPSVCIYGIARLALGVSPTKMCLLDAEMVSCASVRLNLFGHRHFSSRDRLSSVAGFCFALR